LGSEGKEAKPDSRKENTEEGGGAEPVVRKIGTNFQLKCSTCKEGNGYRAHGRTHQERNTTHGGKKFRTKRGGSPK